MHAYEKGICPTQKVKIFWKYFIIYREHVCQVRIRPNFMTRFLTKILIRFFELTAQDIYWKCRTSSTQRSKVCNPNFDSKAGSWMKKNDGINCRPFVGMSGCIYKADNPGWNGSKAGHHDTKENVGISCRISAHLLIKGWAPVYQSPELPDTNKGRGWKCHRR